MTNSRCVIHLNEVAKLNRFIKDQYKVKWVYLGTDILKREKAAKILSNNERYSIGSLLDDLAFQMKQPFLDFISNVGSKQKNQVSWWASNLAYKNPLTDNYFLFWCYEAVIKEIIKNNDSVILIIEDSFFYQYLQQNYQKELRFFKHNTIFLKMKLIMRGLSSRFLLFLKISRSIINANLYFKESPKSIDTKIYLFSWLEERFFAKTEMRDAYLGKLPQLINSNGKSFAYIVPMGLPKDLIAKAGKFCDIILLEKYLRFSDLLKSFFTIFTVKFDSKKDKKLFLHEVFYEFAYSSFPYQLLNYYALKRFIQSRRQKNFSIIYPFENQPWEKMLSLAKRKEKNCIKLIAYQHTTIPLLLLNYFLGTDEAEYIPLPDYIITNGEHSLKILQKAGYRNVQIINGGAFRFENNNSNSQTEVTIDKRELKKVLVCLPYSENLAIEILLAVIYSCSDLIDQKIEFIIKSHPNTPIHSLPFKFPEWPANFQESIEIIGDLLSKVDLVIYSSSTVGMEALLKGIPVFNYCSEYHINLNPLDSIPNLNIQYCNEKNLREIIWKVLHDGVKETTQVLQEYELSLEKVFSPVNNKVWEKILDL